jgi:hypothetical protein
LDQREKPALKSSHLPECSLLFFVYDLFNPTNKYVLLSSNLNFDTIPLTFMLKI